VLGAVRGKEGKGGLDVDLHRVGMVGGGDHRSQSERVPFAFRIEDITCTHLVPERGREKERGTGAMVKRALSKPGRNRAIV